MTENRAFSLVELSIVLVILGLLTGGILAGQSLIRAAELRSITSEQQRYATAIQSFRDKYFALPGDMNNATRFWLRTANTGDCVTNSAAAVGSPGTCDGNGDGSIGGPAAVSQSGEWFQAWRHMALAGLIEGSYSGYAVAAGTPVVDPTNSPRSKFSNGYWQISTSTAVTGHAAIFDRVAGLGFMQFGGYHATGGNRTPLLRPEEAWNIDTKMDDGKPGTGNTLARTNEDTYGFPDFSTATASSQLTADYRLSETRATCAMGFKSY